jgi:hypothetical protein
MDPQVVWDELCKALRKLKADSTNIELREEVASCLRALLEWIEIGGFPPTVEE